VTATLLRQSTVSLLTALTAGEPPVAVFRNVFDSRTTPLAPTELPAAIVVSAPASLSAQVQDWCLWYRKQTLVVSVEFEAATDAVLAAACDTYETAVWACLTGDRDWRQSWNSAPTVSVQVGRDAQSDRRRGVVELRFEGQFEVTIPDPSTMGLLREIRLATIESSPAAEIRVETEE
jgi:hypothetical protein